MKYLNNIKTKNSKVIISDYTRYKNCMVSNNHLTPFYNKEVISSVFLKSFQGPI